MRESSTRGDGLAEGVASKLQLFTVKDYPALFSRLSEAATAYQVARDHEGAQVRQNSVSLFLGEAWFPPKVVPSGQVRIAPSTNREGE